LSMPVVYRPERMRQAEFSQTDDSELARHLGNHDFATVTPEHRLSRAEIMKANSPAEAL